MAFDRTKPDVDYPGGQPPADLVIEDQIVGDGPEATPGSTVSAQYVGVLFSSGEEFDSSWTRGTPLEFLLGVGRVIAGWDRGIAGMRVGGRRTLVIPPSLAYGTAGLSGVIPPNETLIFVVDLVKVS